MFSLEKIANFLFYQQDAQHLQSELGGEEGTEPAKTGGDEKGAADEEKPANGRKDQQGTNPQDPAEVSDERESFVKYHPDGTAPWG